LDVNAFLRDDEEAIYWTGFSIADTCVGDNGTFSAALQVRDRNHLVKLKRFLDAAASIKTGKGNATCFRPGRPFVKLTVASKLLTDSLALAGVLPRKTGTERLLRYEMSRHAWRGAIDGDGTLGRHKRGYFYIKLYGSRMLCEQFREYVLTLVPTCRAKVQRSKTIFAFGVCCGPANTVIRELYGDCSVYLTRKKRAVAPLLRRDQQLA
jgi:hypothetical protein